MANVLNVNPNRMELIRLRQRMSLAKRGHKLLKDKQDELMERFTKTIRAVRDARKEIEEKYENIKNLYFISRYLSSRAGLFSLCKNPPVYVSIKGEDERVMNLNIPELTAEFDDRINDLGVLNLSSVLGVFLKKFLEIVQKIVDLANAERRMFMISEELKKVRRRVNALEYIFIPKLEETIEYISMQLEEQERETITRLMKIKEIVRSK